MRHDNLQAIPTPREQRKPQNLEQKKSFNWVYLILTGSMNASRSPSFHEFMSPYFHQWQSSTTLPYKLTTPQNSSVRSDAEVMLQTQPSKSFSMVIQPLSTRLIKANFCLTLPPTQHHRISTKQKSEVYRQTVLVRDWSGF